MERSFQSCFDQKKEKIFIDEEEENEEKNLRKTGEIVNKVISVMRLTLISRDIIIDSPEDSIGKLQYFTRIICEEYLKASQKIRKICLTTGRNDTQEVPVNMRDSNSLISKIFEKPKENVKLSQDDCKNLSEILVGTFRDSACKDLSMKLIELQKKIIKSSKEIQELRENIKEKEKLTEVLTEKINLKKMALNKSLSVKTFKEKGDCI